MIYGPLGHCVCCSLVTCPVLDREKTTHCKSEDLKCEWGDEEVGQILQERNQM